MKTTLLFLDRPSNWGRKVSKSLVLGVLGTGIAWLIPYQSASMAQTCNPYGCSVPGASECNPFGCPNPGAAPCNPFGCPASPRSDTARFRHQADSREFKVCNKTGSPVTMAIAYPKDEKWWDKGWWTLDPGKCKTVDNTHHPMEMWLLNTK